MTLSARLRPWLRPAPVAFVMALLAALWHGALSAPWFPLDHYVLSGGTTYWSDALAYHQAARDLVEGMGLRENAWPVTLYALRAPGCVLWLGGLGALGLDATGMWIAQCALLGGLAALSAALSERAFGRRAGWVGIAIALYRPMLDLAQLPMSEVPFAFLCALGLWIAPGRPLVAGLTLGIASTFRSIALPFSLAAAAFVALRGARRPALRLALGALLPLLLLCARNGLSAGTYSPAATYHVWTAWAEFQPPRPDSDDAHFAAFLPLREAGEAVQQASFRHAFLHRIRTAPEAYLARVYQLVRSTLRLPFEGPDSLAELALLPLLVAAGYGLRRARDVDAAVLLGLFPIVGVVGTAALGEGPGRFRMPFDWALLVLVAGGLSGLLPLEPAPAAAPPHSRWLRRAPWVLAPLALLAIVRIAIATPPAPLAVAAAGLDFSDYARKVGGDPATLDGRTVRWAGIVEPLAHLEADRSDPRSPLFASRPYARTVGAFLVDGPHGPADGQRIWIELPDSLGAALPVGSRLRAVVTARIDTMRDNPSRHRARVIATQIELVR